MQTFNMQGIIEGDGTIHLDIASGLPPGSATITLFVQPSPPSNGKTKARSGVFLGKASRVPDLDAALDEMNALWKAKLLDLHS